MGRIIHGNIVVDTLTLLKALTAVKSNRVFVNGYSSAGDGGGGEWVFDDSDLSTEVTADSNEGIYAPPDSDSTGASGAWVRQYFGPINVLWFGCTTSLTATQNTTKIQTIVDTLSGGFIYIPYGVDWTYSSLTSATEFEFIDCAG